MDKAIKKTLPESGIKELIDEISSELRPGFVLWLKGEMGAGKTSFVRNFLRLRGLPENHPVVSPTYTILNEYSIGQDWYAHMDLYRAEENFSMDEIGVKESRNYCGMFIEWPNTPSEEETIAPTHLLEIEYLDGTLDKRSYHFRKI